MCRGTESFLFKQGVLVDCNYVLILKMFCRVLLHYSNSLATLLLCFQPTITTVLPNLYAELVYLPTHTLTNLCMSIYCFADPSAQGLSRGVVFARENRQAIMGKFADFQTKVCEKLIKNGVDTQVFRQYVTNRFPPGDCIPPPPANMIEIFKAITYHGLWDYLHYSPLEQVVKMFCPDDLEIDSCVQTYKNDLKAYCIVTTLNTKADLEVADPSAKRKRAKYDPRYFIQVEWKTEFVDHSLQYLAEVWEKFSSHYLVPDSPPTSLLDRVRRGCFLITWLVPSHLIKPLIRRVKVDTEFFQQHHILRVTVGDKCIYEKFTDKSKLVSSSRPLWKVWGVP